MFVKLLRIMNVDGIKWIETIPDTMYRSPRSHMIICRTRGRHSKGKIMGSRFYCWLMMPNGKYRKLKGEKDTIRYFNTPLSAASEAAKALLKIQQDWVRTQLVDEVTALTLEAKSLREEIDALKGIRNRLNEGRVKPTEQIAKAEKVVARTIESFSGLKGLPTWLKRSAQVGMNSTVH